MTTLLWQELFGMNMDLCSCFSDLIYTKDRKVFIYLIILGKALLGLHQAWVLWCSGIKLSIQIYQKKKKTHNWTSS